MTRKTARKPDGCVVVVLCLSRGAPVCAATIGEKRILRLRLRFAQDDEKGRPSLSPGGPKQQAVGDGFPVPLFQRFPYREMREVERLPYGRGRKLGSVRKTFFLSREGRSPPGHLVSYQSENHLLIVLCPNITETVFTSLVKDSVYYKVF